MAQLFELCKRKGDEHNEDRTKFLRAIKPILEHPSFIISFTKPTLNQEELKRVKNGLRVPEKHPYNIYFRPCKIDGKTIPLMCIVAMIDNGPTLISCREVKDLYDTVKNGDKLLYKIEDSQQENN